MQLITFICHFDSLPKTLPTFLFSSFVEWNEIKIFSFCCFLKGSHYFPWQVRIFWPCVISQYTYVESRSDMADAVLIAGTGPMLQSVWATLGCGSSRFAWVQIPSPSASFARGAVAPNGQPHSKTPKTRRTSWSRPTLTQRGFVWTRRCPLLEMVTFEIV